MLTFKPNLIAKTPPVLIDLPASITPVQKLTVNNTARDNIYQSFSEDGLTVAITTNTIGPQTSVPANGFDRYISSNVKVYSISPTTGVWTQIYSFVSSGLSVFAVAGFLSPDGRFCVIQYGTTTDYANVTYTTKVASKRANGLFSLDSFSETLYQLNSSWTPHTTTDTNALYFVYSTVILKYTCVNTTWTRSIFTITTPANYSYAASRMSADGNSVAILYNHNSIGTLKQVETWVFNGTAYVKLASHLVNAISAVSLGRVSNDGTVVNMFVAYADKKINLIDNSNVVTPTTIAAGVYNIVELRWAGASTIKRFNVSSAISRYLPNPGLFMNTAGAVYMYKYQLDNSTSMTMAMLTRISDDNYIVENEVIMPNVVVDYSSSYAKLYGIIPVLPNNDLIRSGGRMVVSTPHISSLDLPVTPPYIGP